MNRSSIRIYSPYVRECASLLGHLIQLARKEKRWTEQQLADRAGISRATLKKIEKGDLKCEIGLVFELAALTGVTLFEEDRTRINLTAELVKAKLALLPKSVRRKKEVKDDF